MQPKQRASLESIVRSTHLAAAWVRRAQVLLLLAEGLSVRAVQARTGMSPRRQRHWKQQFEQQGLDGLLDADRPGRPKKLNAAKAAAILAATEQPPASPLTHWSTRRLARQVGVSHSTVMRVWHQAGLQPHRLQRYMASPDAHFEAKAKAILGLYLHPPENAVVVCVDEKTAIQVLDRTQPGLPMRARQPTIRTLARDIGRVSLIPPREYNLALTIRFRSKNVAGKRPDSGCDRIHNEQCSHLPTSHEEWNACSSLSFQLCCKEVSDLRTVLNKSLNAFNAENVEPLVT